MTIRLPWFPSILGPNVTAHWRKKHKAFQAYKADCILAMHNHRDKLRGASRFKITFKGPDYRRRDTDNCIGAIKAAIDALSHVTGVDDSMFSYEFVRQGMVKGGAVEVEILA